MKPITDIEVILLIAVGLAAKRKPAPLASVMAAADLTPGALAAEFKLTAAIARLSAHGLIYAEGEELALTAMGEDILAAQPKKAADIEIRIARIKETLEDYHASGDDEPIDMSVEQVRAAIAAHRSSKQVPARNMLLPKPKPPADDKRKGVWRGGGKRRG